MKKSNTESELLTTEELLERFSERKPKKNYQLLFSGVLAIAFIAAICSAISFNSFKIAKIDSLDGIASAISPMAAASGKKDVISIPSGIVKANPFVPYRQIAGDPQSKSLVNDVPNFALVEPPEIASENSEAAKIMDTVVSGILYDKFSPSAIINIDGNDYLVKRGDTVNNYKILAIARDSVTIKLGSNTYKAGIGEAFTEGSININEVSNLSKKFGGEQR